MTAQYRRWTPPKTYPCHACDGVGRTECVEWDEHGSWPVRVRCEACRGLGDVAQCTRCGDVMSIPEAETTGYHCGPCCRELEMTTEAESVRILRAG